MIKRLLATTALVTIFATAGFAAGSAAAPAAQSAVTAPHYQLASQLIGQTVYSGDAQNAESIGKISDLVIADDGSVRAVVIGVGGFLGIGEKNVAVDFGNLQRSLDSNNAERMVLATTKQDLQNAPAFDAAALAANVAWNYAAKNSAGNAATTTMAANPPPANTKTARPQLKPIDPSTTIAAKDLTGKTVYSADNQNIGEVGDVVLTKDGKIDAVVLDVGGFLGIGKKSVAIAFKALRMMADADNNLYLYTDFTKDELNAAAAYDKDKYPTARDSMLLRSKS